MKENKSKSMHDYFGTSAYYAVHSRGYARLFNNFASAISFAYGTSKCFPYSEIAVHSLVSGSVFVYSSDMSGNVTVKDYEVRPL